MTIFDDNKRRNNDEDTDSVINDELDKKELDDEDMDTDGGDEDDTDDEDEDDPDEDDKEEQDPDVFDVLVDIATTFNYLKRLRIQYRDLLPQLKEMKQNDMGCSLQLYSHVETTIIEEQDGLEELSMKNNMVKS